jgi:hypothetical protein
MKKLKFFLLCLCLPLVGCCGRDSYEYKFVAISGDPDTLYRSANEFAAEIGRKLKTRPLKVVDVDVSLSQGTQLQMIWSCRLVSVPPAAADRYFDRRGAMLSRPSMADAQNAVHAAATAPKMLRHFVGVATWRRASCAMVGKEFLCDQEVFMAARGWR